MCFIGLITFSVGILERPGGSQVYCVLMLCWTLRRAKDHGVATSSSNTAPTLLLRAPITACTSVVRGCTPYQGL